MYFFIKRLIDIFISLLALLILFPVLALISLGILISSGLPILYVQERVGKEWRKFQIIKFRTMVDDADQIGPGISSEDDLRITKIGKFLRKFKLDELPQFLNVLVGDMSLIGPRPELLRFAEFYRDDYSYILSVRPGITDYASVNFRHEAALMNGKADGESYYLKEILPQKIILYKKYLKKISLTTDIQILFSTIKIMFK